MLQRDSLEWRSNMGVMPFTVNMVWNCIRPRNEVVAWSDVIWFSKCIPRHAFHFWLVLKRKLKTQDTLRSWDVGSSLSANQVWNDMKVYAGLPNAIASFSFIVDSLIPISKRRSAKSMKGIVIAVLAMLVVPGFIVHPSEAISCLEVDHFLEPCLDYLKNGGTVPKACCDGLEGLKDECQSRQKNGLAADANVPPIAFGIIRQDLAEESP
ncbi:non-specific lipid-transfer protein AP10-like protein [Tanacetum coccineum]